MSQHSLGKNLRWIRLVIAQWLYSSECWALWKEIGLGWYIVGDKRRLVLSVPDRRDFVKVTWACTVADCSLSVHLPPACLSVFQSLNRLGKHSLSSAFIKGPLLYEWMDCTSVGILLKALERLEKWLQRLLCAIDIKAGKWYKDKSPFVHWKWDINLQMGFIFLFRKRNSHTRQGPEDTYFSSSGRQKNLSHLCIHFIQLNLFY